MYISFPINIDKESHPSIPSQKASWIIWSSRTYDLLFKMIIDLNRSIDQRWLLMSAAIFILSWSCFLSTLWPHIVRNTWNILVPSNVPNCFLTIDMIRPLEPSQRCQEIPDNTFKHTIIWCYIRVGWYCLKVKVEICEASTNLPSWWWW